MANAINVAALNAYIDEQRYPLLRKAILGGDSISRMVPQLGVKTKAKINYMSSEADFQDGTSCGFNPSGSTVFTQREIETGTIKEEMEWCYKVFWGKYLENEYRIQSNPQAMPFEQEITDELVKKIQNKLEKAVWQGDKSSEDPNLNKFDGLLKILGDSGNTDSIEVTGITSATTAYDAVKKVIENIPEVILDKAEVLVSPAFYRKLSFELVEKNMFHYDFGNGAVNDAMLIFPGTSVVVRKVQGLTGVNKIVATPWDNLYYAADLMGEEERFRLWYSEEDEMFRFRSLWNSGVQVAFLDEVVIADLG